MTLNITVIHPECICIAADFRLSRFSGERFEPLTDSSMKVVQFEYESLHGVITYTGIGRVGRIDTAQTVAGWLANRKFSTLAEIADLLASEGTVWLRALPANRHTFVVAGFESNRAGMMIVSNFEGFDRRPRSDIARELHVTALYAKGRAIVKVTGAAQAVPRERQRLLKRTVDAFPRESSRAKQIMLDLIARASHSPYSAGSVSINGAAFSLLPDGSGQLALTEAASIETYSVTNGLLIPPIGSLLKSLGRTGMKLVGSSYSGLNTGSTRVQPQSCDLSILDGADDFEISELRFGRNPPHRAHAIRNDGAMIVSHCPTSERAVRQYLLHWRSGDSIDIDIPQPNFGDFGCFGGSW